MSFPQPPPGSPRCAQRARRARRARLELRQAGVLLGHLVREARDHGLLHRAHKAERLLLLDGHVLLVLVVQQARKLVQRRVQALDGRQALVLRRVAQAI